MPTLKLLWLHDLGDPRQSRTSVWNLETLLSRRASGHIVVNHDVRIDPPELVRGTNWDGVFLGPTALCSRYSPERLRPVLKRFAWVRDLDAPVFALPQDDYDCSAVLDDWLVSWGVRTVWSVLSEFREATLPRFVGAGGTVLQGYTGYIESSDIQDSTDWVAHDERFWHVTYRSIRLPAHFGFIGWQKSAVPEAFRERLTLIDRDLRADISTRPADVMTGPRWQDFLQQSRACLAMPSGSSLLDPWGDHRRRVARYVSRYPDAPFEEIRDVCFPGQDGIYRMTALSPRNLEAALWGAVQIAPTEGGIASMLTEEHYIPLELDFSNLDDVVGRLLDSGDLARTASRAREAALSQVNLRADHAVRQWVDAVAAARTTPRKPDIGIRDDAQAEAYNRDMLRRSQRYWSVKRVEWRARELAKAVASRVGGSLRRHSD